MRKKLMLLVLCVLCLTGCAFGKTDNNNSSSNNNNSNTVENNTPDEGTPNWWIDMFTCNNVTIKNTHKTMGTEIIYF